jgi:RNA polymerase sigma factor (sigma-70 family)
MEIERYRRPAYATALALLGDHHLAEDAVQDALLEAHRSWDRLREPERRAAWVRAIVRHRCYRTLRRRDLGVVPLPEIESDDPPWRLVARREERGRLMERVKALPPRLREVVALHYLSGVSHRETATFLGLPATTVNNRLHLARRILRGDSPMTSIPQAGTVLSVEPPVVDVRFAPDGAPDVFDTLAAADATPNLRVVQTLGDGVVRCVLIDDVTPSVGQCFVNRTADGGTYMAGVVTKEQLAEVVQALGELKEGIHETGIKPIDLFCPLPSSGNVALLGTAGTGKLVVTMELVVRLGGAGPQLFCLSDRREPAFIRDLREASEEFDRRVVWLVSDVANDPEFAQSGSTFDAVIYTSPLLGIRGLWPAVDPLRSRSSVEVGERHARVAAEARDLLSDARARTYDPVLMEYLAVRAMGAALRRVEETADPDDAIVSRARLLEAFLTHPFDVAEDFTGGAGEGVPLEAALDGVEAILAGDCDDRAPEDLRFIGGLGE